MSGIAMIVADNLDIWTSAIERKGSAGRGSSKKINLYGIERLRSLILDLAVRSKLAPQNPREGSAADLVGLIRSEKPNYLKEHSLPNRTKAAEPILEQLFELPENWKWARLGEIAAYIQRGKSPKYDQGSGRYVVSQRCVQWAGLDLSVAKEIGKDSLESYEDYRFLRLGDLLWNSTGTGTIGRVIALGDVPEMLVCDSHVTLVRCPWVDPGYLQSWLASNAVYGQIESAASGSTNQIEWTAKLAMAQPVPLPPLAEQKRIVAKVDELMALCDALERESENALDAHQTLVETLLATLVNSTDAADLAKNWARLENHFDTLFTTETSVDALKQTILDLAVRGRLVEPNAEDEPASKLLARAVANRESMAAASNRRRKADYERSISKCEAYASRHWEWAHIGEFSQVKGGKRIPKGKGYSDHVTDHVYIRVTDMSNGGVDLDDLVYIDDEVFSSISHYTISDADIYVTIAGTIGHVGRVPNILDGQILTENAAKIVFSEIDQEFLIHVLNSDDVQSQFANKTQAMAQPKLALKRIAGARVPIPPLAEQKRIVAKVEELLVLCDALKSRLSDAAETQRHLADAIVQTAAA